MKKILMALGSIVAGVLLFGMPFAAAADSEQSEVDGGSNEGSAIPSLSICTDGIDNDHDGLADAADPDCAPYYRMLRVDKYVVGTTTSPSAFSFTITGEGVPSLGTHAFDAWGENFFPNTLVGEYHITEVAAPGYTVSYNNCGTATEGDFPLTIPVNGVDEVCTITNTWITTPLGTTTPGGEGTTTPPTATTTPEVGTTTPPADTSGTQENNTGGSSHHRGGRSGSSSGSVLGASTCGPLLVGFLKKGDANESAITALQDFLNKELGISLPTTGVFDDATEAAVSAFQVKYWEEVLAPWVKFGLASDHTPTGFVYKTTLHKINELFCNGLNQPEPELP